MRRDDKSELPTREDQETGRSRSRERCFKLANCHPGKGMDLNHNKREFKDAVHLRYYWHISEVPNVGVCGKPNNVDHAMICKRGGFIIQRHNELRDLQAQMLNLVCHDVEIEPVLQEITSESLARGANTAPDARLDTHARGFWSRQGSTFFDVRVCHPNVESYKDLTPQHENREETYIFKPNYGGGTQATFTPLVFTTTGGMAPECQVYHKRLAELLSAKKVEDYSTTMSWIRTRISFEILRTSLLRGSRSLRRVNLNLRDGL